MVFDVDMKIIEFIKEEKTGLIVSCVAVSLLGLLVHIIHAHSVNLETFVTWLPVSWFMVFVLGFGFKLFLEEKK